MSRLKNLYRHVLHRMIEMLSMNVCNEGSSGKILYLHHDGVCTSSNSLLLVIENI